MNAVSYDDLYKEQDGRYSRRDPAADAADDYHVHLVAGICGLRSHARVLDLGSGHGHYIRAWMEAGFEVRGLELSSVARSQAHPAIQSRMLVADVTKKETWSREFFYPRDLVFSSQLLEHLTDQQISTMVEGAFRVAPIQVHFIAHEKGNDPTHINIKSRDEWSEFFGLHCTFAGWINNVLYPEHPVHLLIRDTQSIPVLIGRGT